MAKYIIEGGTPLKGSVRIPGAKNAGFKLMIAALLSDERSTLTNIPYIRDVIAVKKIIESIGPKIEFSDDVIQISGSVNSPEIPEELGLKSRASFMYLPILLRRFGKAKVSFPGGDQIGERPINWFLDGLKLAGVEVKISNSTIEAASPGGLRAFNYTFPKNSHTATEGLILVAAMADGKTIIENAASEPEIGDLIKFLNNMGTKIKRTKPRTLEIQGVNSLKGTVHKVMPDRNEAVTFSCLALGTKGDIQIENVEPNHLNAFESEIINAGGGWDEGKSSVRVYFDDRLNPTDITTAPHPGFMTDWQSLWTALMTQAIGQSTVHETIFESRFGFVTFLQKMGAKIELFSPEIENPENFYNFEWNEKTKKLPHAARIAGPTTLSATKMEITDIRAGATLVFAALMAEGKSEISGIEHLERGYENLDGRLESLGAKIQKLE